MALNLTQLRRPAANHLSALKNNTYTNPCLFTTQVLAQALNVKNRTPNNLVIAIGSNVGDRLENLTKAIAAIKECFHSVATSKVYETKPILYLPQQNFFNMAVLCQSYCSHPQYDFHLLSRIEKSLSISKTIPKGPRQLDLDLIFWNKTVHHSSNLIIPHYGFANRDFVLEPIRDIMPVDFLNEFHLPKNIETNILNSFHVNF